MSAQASRTDDFTMSPEPGEPWVFGLVQLDDSPTFEAIYNPRVRWNGWLCPYLDRENTSRLIEFINGLGGDDGHFEWDGDVVVGTIEYDLDEPPSIEYHEPIYIAGCPRWTIGAFSWVWSEA